MSSNLEFHKRLRLLIEEEMVKREALKDVQVQSVYIELAAFKAAEDVSQLVICALNKRHSEI